MKVFARDRPLRGARIARALAFVVAASVLGAARADVVDPTLPRTVVVGPPKGYAPSERLDERRTGRSSTRLPAVPVEVWRRHVSGSIDFPPLVDGAGNILVPLTVPELVKLGPDAREIWRARLGNAPPLGPPTLLSDGTVAVVTAAGVAWGFWPNGSLRFSTPLAVGRRDADTAPLALEDGGLLIAAGSTLVELDADGAIRSRTQLDEHGTERAVGALVASPIGALVTTTTGHVYSFRSPSPPRRVGSFGGTPTRGAMLADDHTLVAIVDMRRLVALDLRTGATHVRASGVALDGLPALGDISAYGERGSLLFFTTQLGMLVGLDAAGNERVHAALEKVVVSAFGGIPGVAIPTVEPPKLSPPVVVDPGGRVAFVRGNGRAGVVSPTGRVEIAADPVCGAPVAVVPAGDKRLLIACHDGRLWMYGE